LTTYIAVHIRLATAFGSAKDRDCIQCGKPAIHWAYQYGAPDEQRDETGGWPYSEDLSFYKPMCGRCHAKFDKEKVTHCPAGHEYTKENTYIYRNHRYCKPCRRLRELERRRRERRIRTESRR